MAAVRALGLRVALSAKFLERNIIIVDNLQLTVSRHTEGHLSEHLCVYKISYMYNATMMRLPPMYRGLW